MCGGWAEMRRRRIRDEGTAAADTQTDRTDTRSSLLHTRKEYEGRHRSHRSGVGHIAGDSAREVGVRKIIGRRRSVNQKSLSTSGNGGD